MQNLILENQPSANSYLRNPSGFKTLQQPLTETDIFHNSLQNIVNKVKESVSRNAGFIQNLANKLKHLSNPEINARQLAAYNFLIAELKKGGVETIAIYKALDSHVGNSLNFVTADKQVFNNLKPSQFLDKTHEFGLDITLNQESIIQLGQAFYKLKNFDPSKHSTQKSVEITQHPEITSTAEGVEAFWSKAESYSVLQKLFYLIFSQAKGDLAGKNVNWADLMVDYCKTNGPLQASKTISRWVDTLKNNHDLFEFGASFSDKLLYQNQSDEIKVAAFNLIKPYLKTTKEEYSEISSENPFTLEEYNAILRENIPDKDLHQRLTIEQAITEDGLPIWEDPDSIICADSFYINRHPWKIKHERG
jgi:hypothetical protein